MSEGTYTVNVYWTGALGASGTAYNITPRVKSLRISRGRNSEHEPVASVGKCEMTVHNEDGLFSPGNAASRWYPNVLPMKKVEVSCTLNGTANPLFVGWLQRIQPNPRPDQQECFLDCADGMEILRLTECRTEPYQNVNIGTLIGNVLDIAGTVYFPSTARVLDTGDLTPQWAFWDRENCLEAISQLCESEHGIFYINRGGTAVFERRSHRWGTVHTTGAAATVNKSMIDLRYDLDVASVYNDISVTTYNRTVGAEAEIWRSEGTTPLLSSGSVSFKCEHNAVVSTVTTPVFGTSLGTVSPGTADIVANTSPDGSGSFVMNGTVTLTAKSRSSDVIVTAGTACYLTTVRLRGTPLGIGEGETSVAKGTPSGTVYGWRKMPLDFTWQNRQELARSITNGLLRRYRDPQPSVSATLARAAGGTVAFADMLTKEISDPVDITETDTGMGTTRLFIGAVSHEISEGGEIHTTTWQLENKGTENYWILGLGTLGGPNTNIYTTALGW